MRSKRVVFAVACLICLLANSCARNNSNNDPEIGLPNPASVYCEENGGKLELRTDEDGSVRGVCIFPDGSECEEWSYYRHECAPASTGQTDPSTNQPAESDEPVTSEEISFSAEDYQGWWIYKNDAYSFWIMLPEDWAVDELYTSDPLMSGHFLRLHPRIETENDLNIRMSIRRLGEETLLWPTGVGAGEFVPLGTLDVGGQLTRRIGFKCPGGKVSEIWYHGPEETNPNIQLGDLQFGFIASVSGDYCQPELVLEGKIARLADMIVASLDLF